MKHSDKFVAYWPTVQLESPVSLLPRWSWLFLGMLLVMGHCALATDYYVSNQGNDANVGTSSSSPWKTLTHVSAQTGRLKPGDRILLQRGSIFFETLTLDGISGTASLPIIVQAYGSGANPIISGAVRVSQWQSAGGKIWKASCSDCPAALAAVFRNDVSLSMGRYPNLDAANGGYLTVDSSRGFHDNRLVKDQEMASFSKDHWQGGQLVARTRRWLLDRARIASHVGMSIYLSESLTYGVLQGFGYFIQDHPETLDQDGEWYYDKTARQLFLYQASGSPHDTRIEVPVRKNALVIANAQYITVQNITFEHGSEETVRMVKSKHCVFSNNNVLYSGRDGLSLGDYGRDDGARLVDDIEISYNTIDHSMNTGLMFFGNNSNMHDNQIQHSALVLGLGASGNQQQSGVYISGSNSRFEYNKVINSGYNGIHFRVGPWKIRYNLVDSYCMTKDDGAGIYTYKAASPGTEIAYNIILNGIGAPLGSSTPDRRSDRGLYADGSTSKIVYDHNTISQSGEGMLVHNSNTLTITNNTFEGSQSHSLRISRTEDNGTPNDPMRNLSVTNNLLVASQDVQALYEIGSFLDNDIPLFGTIDYNMLCQPTQSFLPATTYAMNIERFHPAVKPKKAAYYENWYYSFQALSSDSPYGKHDQNSPVAYDRYKVTGSPGKNLLLNSGIDKELYDEPPSWAKETTNNDKFIIGRVTEAALDGASLRARFTDNAAGVRGSIVYKSIPLEAGETYAFSFDVKGVNTSQLVLRMATMYGGHEDDIQALRPFMVTPERAHHQYIFRATTTTTQGRIYIDMTEANQRVWFDNLELHEVNAQEQNLVRVEYNASKTAKQVNVGGGYRRVDGTAVSGKITLPPFESVVLIRDPGYVEPPVVESGKLPWRETFELPNGTLVDDGSSGGTAWRLIKPGGNALMQVENGSLVASGTYEEGQWRSEQIDISGKAVKLSFDLTSSGSLESTNDYDYVKVYYRIDNNHFTLVKELKGNISRRTLTVDSIRGTTVELMVKMRNTDRTETYYLDNVLVESVDNTWANVPWGENFNDGQNYKGTLETDQMYSYGSLQVDQGKMTARGVGHAAWKSEVMALRSNTVTMSLVLSSQGELESTNDYDAVQVYLRIDGGPEQLVKEVKGNIAGYYKFVKNGITGTSLQIVVRFLISDYQEFYFLDGVAVDVADGTNARQATTHALAQGADELPAPEWLLYPNPAQDQVWVTTEQAQSVRVTLLGARGEVMSVPVGVSSQQEITLDVSGLSPGLYVLQTVTAEGKRQTHPFIKQ